jgi:hypothetical protein
LLKGNRQVNLLKRFMDLGLPSSITAFPRPNDLSRPHFTVRFFMLRRHSSLLSSGLLAGLAAFGLSLLAGCGAGTLAPTGTATGSIASPMSGILHGGPNPIVGATITLYTTSGSGYGAAATAVATTTTDSSGFFNFTLPANIVACPAGQYAYIGAYSGSTGAFANNPNTLLMAPIGACSDNYTVTGSGPFVNTYTGSSLWIDELSTAISAYTLGRFMTVTNAGVINIGAPANNLATASTSSPAAAGLAHAFANALSIINTQTGQPNGYTHGGSSKTTGGVIPVAEIYLLGNILQTCVNSTGVTGTNTATANDGSGCGSLFSFTTPPQAGAAVPTNTLQAMVNLARYSSPSISTWNTNCTAATGGTNTTTGCLFGLAAPSGAYVGALTSAPPDWALAVVYTSGYGAQTASCTSTCPGLTYPFYVALDYSDNVYVLNYNASAATSPNSASTWTNIIGMGYDGTPLFSSAEDTTHKAIAIIGTDLAGHVFGANTVSSSPVVQVYSALTGAVVASPAYNNSLPLAIAADPFNNIYVGSFDAGVNLRKLAYTGPSSAPTYVISTATSAGPTEPPYQIAVDSNLDIYEFEAGSLNGASTTNYVCLLTNQSTTPYTYMSAPGTYTNCTGSSATLMGSSSNAAGIGVNSSNGAFAIDSAGITPITKTGATGSATIATGTPTALPSVGADTQLYSRYLSVDGNNWVYSVDGGNGGLSGVSVYDSVDNIALGTYKGCYVSGGVCGTTAGSAPMVSPRGAAIDSSGDVWVVSGAGADLTELIGAAAPTWPDLSMAKSGLPQ